MNTNELKERIHSLVEQVPEDYLKTVDNYLSALSKEDIIPELGCTLTQYNNELNAAIERHRAGKSVTHAEAHSMVAERLQKKYGNED